MLEYFIQCISKIKKSLMQCIAFLGGFIFFSKKNTPHASAKKKSNDNSNAKNYSPHHTDLLPQPSSILASRSPLPKHSQEHTITFTENHSPHDKDLLPPLSDIPAPQHPPEHTNNKIHKKYPIMLAVKRNDLPITLLFLHAKVDVDPKENSMMSALMYTAKKNYIEMAHLLLQHDADVHYTNTQKNTPLIYAAKYNHAEIAHLLLEHGADVNHPNTQKNTALMYAAKYNNFDMVRMLLDFNANIHYRNHENKTAIMMVNKKNHALFDLIWNAATQSPKNTNQKLSTKTIHHVPTDNILCFEKIYPNNAFDYSEDEKESEKFLKQLKISDQRKISDQNIHDKENNYQKSKIAHTSKNRKEHAFRDITNIPRIQNKY